MPQLVGKALLAGLIPLGGLALHGFAASNGLIQKFEDLKADPLLSDGVTLYSTNYTSSEGFNGLLRTLLNFFWPVVNGHDARLSLYSFMFGGQGVALMMLNLLEGMRHGNSGLVVSFVTVYGLLYMVVGLAVMSPLYLLLHLLTSPSAHKPNKTTVAISGISAQGAIFGTLAGYIIPTTLICLPVGSVISVESKALAVVLWQAVPLWSACCALAWSTLASKTARKIGNEPDSTAYVRVAYLSGVAVAGISHVATLAVSFAAWLSPGIFNPQVASTLAPLGLLLPPNPLDRITTVDSFLQGATWFLQWDYTMVSVAYMVWSLTLRYASMSSQRRADSLALPKLALSVLLRVTLFGPIGAALSLVWERDEEAWKTSGPRTGQQKTRKGR